MRFFFKTSMILAFFSLSPVTFAQAVLDISSPVGGFPLDITSQFMSVRNFDDQASPTFDMRLAISIENDFSDLTTLQPAPVEVSVPSIPACPDPSDPRTCFSSGALSIRYQLPLPEDLNPVDGLTGDNRLPSEWIGQVIYFQSCILNSGTSDRCEVSTITILPQIARPTLFNRVSSSSDIDYRWNYPLHEDGQTSLANAFRITKRRNDSVGGTEVFELTPSDVNIIGTSPNFEYQFIDPDVVPGVQYSYTAFNCVDQSGALACPRTQSTGQASVFAEYPATAGTRTDGIEIQWQEYSTSVIDYDLYRCDATNPSVCEVLQTRITDLNFVDTMVEPGVTYFYEVDACSSYSISNPDRCTSRSPRIGRSNLAFLGIDPDQFENDSDAAQAAVISANAPTSLERSFDQQGDVDWLRFTLADASDISVNVSNGVGSTIGIELFDASLNPVGPLSSNLLAARIAAGDYFIRLTDLTPNAGVYVPAPYVASLAAVTVPLAALPDRYEDDNVSTDAKLINEGETQSRTFHQQGDTDWVRFTVSQGSDVRIDATDTLNANIGVQLYDAALNLLDSSPNMALDNRLDPGDYFIRLVEPTPPSVIFSPTAYNLNLVVAVIPPAVLPDQYEDDNIAARAKQIAANAAAQDHTFHVDGDIDWLRFSLSEASNISIDTFNTANADIRIELYDASVSLIENPANSRLQAMELDSGDYLIRVIDASGGAFQALAYSIALSAARVVTDGIQPDKYENDDIPSRAQRVNRPVTQVRNFHLADNNDWIRIVLDKPQSITIATRGTNLADTQIFLYDSEVKRIDYSANTPGVATSHARLVTDTLAAGEYFALINQIDGRDEGFAFIAIERYVLTVDMQPSDRKVDISAIVELLLDD